MMMFAVILVSAFLLPLLYMVTTAFQQPSQIATPGAPLWPAKPQTGTFQGEEYPIYAVPIDGMTRDLMLVQPRAASRAPSSTRPTRPATKIEWQGRWRTLEQSWTFAPLIENFTTRLEPAQLPAAAVQHGRRSRS